MRLLLLCFLVWLPFGVFAQQVNEKDVPEAVLKNFRTQYPGMYVYEWEWKKKKKVYEAEFNYKGKKYEAQFSESGEWLKTEIDHRALSDLPEAVQNAFAQSEWKTWKTDDIEEHHYASGKILYKIEVKRKREKLTLYYDLAGTLVRTT